LSTIPRPPTQKEMINQIWFVLIGSNGDGVVTKVRAISKDMDDIKSKLPTLLPREEHDTKEDRRKMSRREIASLAIAGISTVAAVGATIVAILALGGAA